MNVYLYCEVLSMGKRYRLFREHKYIFYVFTNLLQKVAKANFCSHQELLRIKIEINELKLLLISHADYEESRIHLILQEKGSALYQKAAEDHCHQHEFFERIEEKFAVIECSLNDENEINYQGYEIYLSLRNFFSENLQHFDYEERVLMPELQKLLTDNEIRAIDARSYCEMLPEHMIHMMEVLFPHMNFDDKLVFLRDIKEFEPEKFNIAWEGISRQLAPIDKDKLIKKLSEVGG